MLSGATDPSMAGLDPSFGYTDPTIDSGVNGDGSTSTPDIFQQILNSKVAASTAAALTSSVLGGNKVVQQSNGSYAAVPSAQQGGALGAQSKVMPFFKKIPGWAWIAGGVAFALGVLALLLGGRK